MWVIHEKHCTWHTLKVKRSKVKVTKSCDVVTQNHRIYQVNVTRLWKCVSLIGNRGRRSEWRGQIFDRKFINSRFCACAGKICSKLAYSVVKSSRFYYFYKNRGRWTRWWGQFLDRKQDWCYFCASALKKSPKQRKCIPTEDLFTVTGNMGRRSEWRGHIFDRKLVNRRFLRMRSVKRPKIAYCVVKSPKF